MNKTITKNYLYNLIYQIFIMLIPMITAPYIARTLKVEAIGIYSYTTTISAFCIFIGSLGINLYGQREIAYNRDNKYKTTKKFWEIFLLRLITMFISIVIYYLVFVKNREYSLYFKILIIEIIANIFDITWFYYGIEDIKKIVIYQFIIKMLQVISIFYFIKHPSDLYKYLLIYVISSFISNILLFLNLKKYFVKINLNSLDFCRHIKPAIKCFVPQIANQIYVLVDKTMIKLILFNMTEVGYYEESQKIVRIFLLIVNSLNVILVPKISNFYAKKNDKKIKEYIYKSFNYMLLVGLPISIGLITVSHEFVPIFLGNGYDKVINLVNITSFIIIFLGIINIVGTQYLITLRRDNEYSIIIVVGIIVNIIFNYILIPKYKSIGACFGTIISQIVIVVILLLVIRKEINIRKIIKDSKNYFICSIIMFMCSCCVGSFIDNLFLLLIIKIIVSIIIYFGLLSIIKDDFLLKIKSRLLKTRCKKD